MSSNSANWYLHLGFQWDSPLIGSVWGNGSKEYRFLQYALAKDSEGTTAAWFNFHAQDYLYFFIWNLGSSSSPIPNALNIGFSDLDTPQAYTPSSLVARTSEWSAQTQPSTSNPYLHNTSFNDSPPSACPWGSYSGYSVAGALQFNAPAQCKLSFHLKVDCGSDDSQIFISDPEVIVGSKGNPT